MSVKVVCGAAAVLLAIGQVAQMPQARRLALWTSAGRMLGLEAAPAATPALPAAPVAYQPSLARVETVAPDRYGQFATTVEIEGQRVPVLVDTGATMVSLNYDEADRLGYRPLPSDFRLMFSTANGQVGYAPIQLREIRLGTIVVRNVPAVVAPRGALRGGLLGMSFLGRLSSFRTEDGRLVLHQ